MTNLIGISGKIGSGKDTVGRIIQYLVANQTEPNCIPKLATFSECLEVWEQEEKYDPNCGTDWQIKKFAHKLKQIVSLLTGATIEQLEDQNFKTLPLGDEWGAGLCVGSKTTYREFLQKLGTDVLRERVHPEIWVNALFADYKLQVGKYDNIAIQDSYPKWIITDVRFPNEAQAIKARGGIVIRIDSLRTCPTLTHGTEVIYKPTGEHLYVIEDTRDLRGRAIRVSDKKYDWVTVRPNEIRLVPTAGEHPSETSLDNYEFDYVIDNNGTIEELVEKVKQILINLKITNA